MRFDREPIKKTALDRAMDEYERHFGEPYVIKWGFAKTDEETIDEINRLIAANQKQTLGTYEEGMIY